MGRNLEARVEALVPVEDPALRAELRRVLNFQLADQRCAWAMAADGSYEQRRPPPDRETSTFESMIAWAHAREFEGARLRNRRASSGLAGLEESG